MTVFFIFAPSALMVLKLAKVYVLAVDDDGPVLAVRVHVHHLPHPPPDDRNVHVQLPWGGRG